MSFRLAGALLLFVLLARNVSLYEFGLFSKCFGVAAILGFLVDFGFSQSILRDIAKDPDAALPCISDGLSLKLAISILVLLLTPAFLFIAPSSHNPLALQTLLVGYAITNSFAEFYGVSLRATGRYTEESVLQGAYAAILVLTILLLRPGIYETAIILIALKSAHVALMHVIVRHRIGKVTLSFSLKSWKRTAISGTPYAADAGITNISANVDVIILSSLVGLSSTGVYQAGQKLVQGMSAVALVFSNVYLPKLSRAEHKGSVFRSNALKLTVMMVGSGAIGMALLTLFPSTLVDRLYGDSYTALKPLLPLFGLLLLLRYLNGTAGVILTAMGKQKVRVLSNALSLATLLTTSLFLVPTYGVSGMIYTLLISASVVSLFYFSTLARELTTNCRT